MMFSGLQGMTIPEGVVTQIAKDGVVLWKLETSKPIILEVEKITSNTYAGETTYTAEEFILLDIYPKTNGTVNVTYGGLTKTITDTSGVEEPNAQQVFFGTFNGVSDSVTTPASGTLTIEGGFVGIASGTFKATKSMTKYCGCITSITDFGSISNIPSHAFHDCSKLTSVTIPKSVTSLDGERIFQGCTALTSIVIPESVTSLGGEFLFFDCNALTSIDIPKSVTKLGNNTFSYCENLTNVIIPKNVTTMGANPFSNRLENAKCDVIVESGNVNYSIIGNCLIENATNRLVSGFIDSVIPNGVTIIGEDAFNGLYKVGFKLTIPQSVVHIGSSGLYCSPVNIEFLSQTPPTLDANAFMLSGLQITVPVGCGETYKTAEGWSEYADYIVEVS